MHQIKVLLHWRAARLLFGHRLKGVFPSYVGWTILSIVTSAPLAPALFISGAISSLLSGALDESEPSSTTWIFFSALFSVAHLTFVWLAMRWWYGPLLNQHDLDDLERTVTAPLALRKGISVQQVTDWLTAYARALDYYEERRWSRHKQTAKRKKQRGNQESLGVMGRVTRVVKVVAANPELIKASSGGSLFLFLFWYVVVFVGSVVVVVPMIPALLVGALAEGLIDPNQTEAGVAFGLGFGITHAVFAGPYTILFMVNLLNADECQQIRLAKLRGSPASFTPKQQLLDQWLHTRENAIKRDEKIAAEKARLEAAAAKDLEMDAARSRGLSWDEDDESDSTSPLPAPRDAEHFEEICAIFLKRIGHGSAMRTPTGPDGGIDVISNEAVGQAKFHPSQKVSAEPIRALAGSRLEHGKQDAYFFHYGPGYTDDAINVGHRLGVKLYEFDAQRRVFRRRA